MYKKRTPVLLPSARYSGLLEEDDYILCMLDNARETLQIRKEKRTFCYEVNLHSDIGKLALRQEYGKGDGPWWEFLPGLFLFF